MLILLSYEREIRQNVYPQPNRIRSIFSPYSLPIDSDSVFVSAHYPLRFRIRKKYGNKYGFTSIRPYPLHFHPYILCCPLSDNLKYIIGNDIRKQAINNRGSYRKCTEHVANMHITNKATTEVQIMCLVSYIEMCAARQKIDRDATKSRWQHFLHDQLLKGEFV
jgi:hypothetical protein